MGAAFFISEKKKSLKGREPGLKPFGFKIPPMPCAGGGSFCWAKKNPKGPWE